MDPFHISPDSSPICDVRQSPAKIPVPHRHSTADTHTSAETAPSFYHLRRPFRLLRYPVFIDPVHNKVVVIAHQVIAKSTGQIRIVFSIDKDTELGG